MFNIDMIKIFGKIERVFYSDKKKIIGFVSENDDLMSFKFKNKENYLMLKELISDHKSNELEEEE